MYGPNGQPFDPRQLQQPQAPDMMVEVREVLLPDGNWYIVRPGTFSAGPNGFMFEGCREGGKGGDSTMVIPNPGAIIAMKVSKLPTAKSMPTEISDISKKRD